LTNARADRRSHAVASELFSDETYRLETLNGWQDWLDSSVVDRRAASDSAHFFPAPRLYLVLMKWRALAADYDGTIATDGVPDAKALASLQQFKDAGGAVILVTGRELRDFASLGVDLSPFDAVAAENGGVLLFPPTGEMKLLGAAPKQEFIEELHRRGVAPISVGACIVATWEPHEVAVMQAIKEAHLELHVVFNKGAVMILPAGVNKASGLAAALEALKIAAAETVGVGDAENDHAMLETCGLGVAVDNALPALKERADHVTRADHGAGVAELLNAILTGAFDHFTRKHRF
jgi:hydroxymethylpyrimidine pyrophosphatase-like HAD family hydrolase